MRHRSRWLTRRLSVVVVAPLITAAVLVWPAAADGPTWHPLAFSGTATSALAVAEDGDLLYLATELGLHSSTDGGETWRFVGNGLDRYSAPPVVSLTIDPQDASVVYAGTEQGPEAGLFVSRDRGLHWERLFAGRRDDGVRAVAVSPVDSNLVFMATMTHPGLGDELLVSRDAGNSWEVLLGCSGWHAEKFYTLVPDRSDADTIYVASSLGVLVSHDGGHSWNNSPTLRKPVLGLAVLSIDPSWLVAATQHDIVASRDRGSTWYKIKGPTLPACRVYEPGGLVVTSSTEPTLYVTTRSLCSGTPAEVMSLRLGGEDGEVNWSQLGDRLPDCTELRLAVGGGADPRVYVATADGLWTCRDFAAMAEATKDCDPDEPTIGGTVGLSGVDPGTRTVDEATHAKPVPTTQTSAQTRPMGPKVLLAVAAGLSVAVLWRRRPTAGRT